MSGLESRPRLDGVESFEEEPNEAIQRLNALEGQFFFKKLQKPSLNGDEIDRSLSALEHNLGIIDQIEEEYRDMPESYYAFNEFLKRERYKRYLATFFRRIRGIRQELNLQRQCLLDLARTVEKDKHMVSTCNLPRCRQMLMNSFFQFESLNQYTTIQTSKAFQKLAQTSTNEMMW